MKTFKRDTKISNVSKSSQPSQPIHEESITHKPNDLNNTQNILTMQRTFGNQYVLKQLNKKSTDNPLQRFIKEDVEKLAHEKWEAKGKPDQSKEAQDKDFTDAQSELEGEVNKRAHAIWEAKGKPEQSKEEQDNDHLQASIEHILDTTRPVDKIIGSAQIDRAKSLYKALSRDDKVKLGKVVQNVGSITERLYIIKAIASNHSATDIETFANKIKGKGDNWLQNNLKLTEDTGGKGIKQQFSHSCNITTVQALQGELDPIFSLKLHEDNPDLGKVKDNKPEGKGSLNPDLASKQKAALESGYAGGIGSLAGQKGVAARRDTPGAGVGRFADDLLNNLTASTGLTFTTKFRGRGSGKISMAGIMRILKVGLGKGIPIPLIIGQNATATMHYVLATSISGKNVTIHEPWEGKVETRSEDDLRNDNVNVAGYSHIAAIESPGV